MKKFGIRYHPKVKDDIKKLDEKTKRRIKEAIEKKLSVAPEIYGERLKGTLKDAWKLRVGNYRVVFIVRENTVYVLGIWHRREAYEKVNVKDILKRLKNSP